MIIDIITLLVLVTIYGFFVMCEVALISASPSRLKAKISEGVRSYKLINKIISQTSSYLWAMQIGVTLTGLFAGAFAVLSFNGDIKSFFDKTGFTVPVPAIILIIILIYTYFLLVFGEAIPKRLAARNTEQLLISMAIPINGITLLLKPLVKILHYSTTFFAKILRIGELNNEEDITEEEIRMLIDAGEQTGSIDGNEKEMINNIFEFDNTIVGDVCTHRKDVEAIDISAGFGEVIRVITKEKYSRIPIYEENIDNIVGILHVKDLLNDIFEAYYSGNMDLDIRLAMRKPYFVPLSKKTDELFYEMQKIKIHMAIVVDEYGGTIGLVTMEDLIEEVMGNILDEYDEEEKLDIENIGDNAFSVSGMTSVEAVAEFFNVQLPISEYDTISGFIVGQIGRIPSKNECPEIEFNGLIFKVFKVFENRITDVIVVKV